MPVGPGPLLRGIAYALLALARGEKPNRLTFAPGAEEPAVATHLVEEGIYGMLPGWPPPFAGSEARQISLAYTAPMLELEARYASLGALPRPMRG